MSRLTSAMGEREEAELGGLRERLRLLQFIADAEFADPDKVRLEAELEGSFVLAI